MVDLIEIVYQPDGLEREYNIVLARTRHMIKVNGWDKRALDYEHKAIRDRKDRLEEIIMNENIDIFLHEKSVQEVRDEMIEEQKTSKKGLSLPIKVG